jgi:hypothetical protein
VAHQLRPPPVMLGNWTATIVGIVVILIVQRDVLHELFHPEQTGSLSGFVMRTVWMTLRTLARWRRSFIYRAGPLILVSVVAVWVALLVIGFALIYLPRLPDSFDRYPSLPLSQARGWSTAIYVSLASFTTIGASDLVPKTAAMRMLVTIESLIGPITFTAWITWVLGVYPVLAERRTFTREVNGIRKVWPDPQRMIDEVPVTAFAEMLHSLTDQLRSIDARIQQSRITYYFQSQSRQASLVEQLPYVLALARAAASSGTNVTVAHYGQMLRTAIEELLAVIGEEFLDLKNAPADRVIEALAADHLL